MEDGKRNNASFIALLVPALLLAIIGAAGWLLVELGGMAPTRWWVGVVALVVTATALAYFLVVLNLSQRRIAKASSDRTASERSEIEARVDRFLDDLTGFPARFWFDQSFRVEIARSLRYRRFLSIIIISIDDFTRLNDRHGRAAGDYILLTVADILRKSVRQTDQLARLGGDEFAVVVPETNESGAVLVAERIRRAIELFPFDEQLEVTASVGVTAVVEKDTAGSCLERAEAAAMSARGRGGNGVATPAV